MPRAPGWDGMERSGVFPKDEYALHRERGRCGTFTRAAEPPQFTVTHTTMEVRIPPDPRADARGWLQAIDATTGNVRWKRQWPTPLVAGVTVTTGDVLFTGDLDNNFVAIDASNGKTLYSFNTGGLVGGGVILMKSRVSNTWPQCPAQSRILRRQRPGCSDSF